MATPLNPALKLKQPKAPSTIMNQPGVPAPQLAQRPVQQPAIQTAPTGRPALATPGAAGSPISQPAQPGGVIRPVAQAPAAPAQPPVQGLGYSLYGSSGGTSSPKGTLEAGLRDYIQQGFGGVTSKQFTDRAKQDLASATEGQRAQSVNRINDDAIRRGLFRSGIPSEQAAAAGRTRQSAFATGLADIMRSAEQQNIAGRESAANQAANLLGSNRQWDLQTQSRIEQENARRAAAGSGGPKTFTFVDPDSGQSYELPADW